MSVFPTRYSNSGGYQELDLDNPEASGWVEAAVYDGRWKNFLDLPYDFANKISECLLVGETIQYDGTLSVQWNIQKSRADSSYWGQPFLYSVATETPHRLACILPIVGKTVIADDGSTVWKTGYLSTLLPSEETGNPVKLKDFFGKYEQYGTHRYCLFVPSGASWAKLYLR